MRAQRHCPKFRAEKEEIAALMVGLMQARKIWVWVVFLAQAQGKTRGVALGG